MRPLLFFVVIAVAFAGVFVASQRVESPAVPSNPVAAPPAPEAQPLERLQKFYAQESQRIGKVDPDPALTQQRLGAVAKELNSQEVKWLREQALDAKVEGDARFFATYLLALSEKGEAITALSGIALSPLPKLKNERVISEERMIRSQAVKGMGHQCEKQPGARDALLDVVATQADEELRESAHRALYACVRGLSSTQ